MNGMVFITVLVIAVIALVFYVSYEVRKALRVAYAKGAREALSKHAERRLEIRLNPRFEIGDRVVHFYGEFQAEKGTVRALHGSCVLIAWDTERTAKNSWMAHVGSSWFDQDEEGLRVYDEKAANRCRVCGSTSHSHGCQEDLRESHSAERQDS